MSLNFNVNPYYDDFDANKNFHRVLFKPGYAVQARELTQSQTILQDQISKFGLGVYVDGSKVTGGNISVDITVVTLKIEQNDNIEDFVGLYVVGETSGLIIEVISVDSSNYYVSGKLVNSANFGRFASGENINLFDTKTKAFSSQNSTITSNYSGKAVTETSVTKTLSGTYLDDKFTINTSGISVGDTIAVNSTKETFVVTKINSLNELTVNQYLTHDYSNESSTIKSPASVNAMEVCVDSGVWFTNGLFVRNDSSTIIPDKLNLYPSVVVGFEVTETINDYFDDSELLDPAIGASNYQAPGADRYKVTLELVSKPYVSNQVIENLTDSKFIELIRINKGIIEDKNDTPIFSEISKKIAQTAYDQSGDFVVNPYTLDISNLNVNVNTFSSTISAGKVYITGYPVEHIAPTKMRLEKARDTDSDTYQNIVTYYGNYTTIKNMKGSVINFQTGERVELHNVVATSANSNTRIGTARIRNFLYDSGSGTAAEYKTFLFDVNLANNSFSDVSSMVVPQTSNVYTTLTFSANTSSPSELVDSNYDSLIFPLPQNNIEDVSNINYITTRRYETSSFSNGIYSITTTGSNEDFVGGSGTISSTQAKINYILVATSTSGSYTRGQFIPMDDANVSVSITNSSVGPSQATFDIKGNFNGTATVYATISITSDNLKNKSLNRYEAVKVSAKQLNVPVDLGKSDIYRFRGIYELTDYYSYSGSWNTGTTYNTNSCVAYDDGSVYVSISDSNVGNQPNTSSYWSKLTNNINSGKYSLDNGQRDTHYDHGTLTNIGNIPKNDVVVVFDYFTHSGGEGFFTLNSYADITYSDIPNFTSKLYGKRYSLRDVIDFRPRRTDGIGTTSFDSFQLTQPLENVFVDYSYYLSRIDKIVLQKNGQFKIVRGVSSYINPLEPADIPGALTIFTISYKAYTFDKNDIFVRPTNLRRYTMKDIGILDRRITNIEYYASLSLLESQVSGQDVTDASGENILFKNGYLVDSFKGQDVGDVSNPDYSVSIDFVDQLARPLFTSKSVDYYNNESQGSFITSPGSKQNNKLSVKNDIVTFSYNEFTLVNQNVATQITNVNPFNVSNWIGDIKLKPSSDIWYDTQSQPIINIVNEDQAAWIASVNGTGNGSQWNDWQINWSGQNAITANYQDQNQVTRDTQAIQNVILSKGLSGALTGGFIVVSSTNQILSTSIVPYARTKDIEFELYGMPPYTYLHTFINKSMVDFCVKPRSTSTGGLQKIDIVSQGSGYVNGNNLSIIVVSGANTVPCIATANVSGGKIVNVDVRLPGSGYLTLPNVSVSGSNTGTAILRANTSSYNFSGLRTDGNGYARGILTIPNSFAFKIPSGSILIEFSDVMFYPTLGSAYAKTTFQSRGTIDTVQTTVVSTRPPISTPKPVIPSGYDPLPPTPLVVLPNGNPIPFSFAPVNNANINTEYTSSTITIYGLEPNYSVQISSSGGTIDAGTSSLSGTFASSKTVTTSSTGSLVVAAKLTTGFTYSQPYVVDVSIGKQKSVYVVTTKTADITPDQFTISPRNNANTSTEYTSSTVTVTGLSPLVSVQLSAGGGTIDAGTSSLSGTFASSKTVTTSASGTLVFAAKGTSSSEYSTSKRVTVMLGGVSADYVITTSDPDIIPNSFTFTDITNAELNTVYNSNTVTVSGLTPYITVTVTSIGGGTVDAGTSSLSGSYSGSKTVVTSGSGTLVVSVKNTSSKNYSSTTSCGATVGGVTGTFNIRTKIEIDSTPDPFNFNTSYNLQPGIFYSSDQITITGLTPNYDVVVSTLIYNIMGPSDRISTQLNTSGTVDAGTTNMSGKFSTQKTIRTSSSGTLVAKAGGIMTESQSYVMVTIGGVTGTWLMVPRVVVVIPPGRPEPPDPPEPPPFTPVWSNDSVSKNAESLTYEQGLQLINQAIQSAGGPNLSSAQLQTLYDGVMAVQGQNPTLAGMTSSMIAITNDPRYSGAGTTDQIINAIISDNTNNTYYWTGQSTETIENATIRYSQNQGVDLGRLSTGGSGKGNICIKDPLTQNFFIVDSNYPNGAFLSSVDLFFATKDDFIPVVISIRPTVNGYPDDSVDILGSIVYKNPNEVNVPSPDEIYNGIGQPTTFTFDHPIYLEPGHYSIMVASTSNQYNVYTSQQGGVKLGTETVISSVTYAGAMFKSQNSQTWIPSAGETLCFHLRICDFAGGTSNFDITSKQSNEIEYDLVQIINSDLTFTNSDSINYKMITKSNETRVLSSAFDIISGQNHNFTSRQYQSSAGDIIIRPSLKNVARFTSPVIDLERLNAVLVRNEILPYTDAATVYESLPGFYNGGSVAKYISKRVTLNNNFDSTGLTVYVAVNRQPGTKIEVYYKVLNGNDQNSFDDQNYVLMDQIFTTFGGPTITGPTDWTEDTYQSLNISYDDIRTGATYNNFKVFAIKICMYSDNPVYVPQLKKLRVIANA